MLKNDKFLKYVKNLNFTVNDNTLSPTYKFEFKCGLIIYKSGNFEMSEKIINETIEEYLVLTRNNKINKILNKI